MARCRCWRWSRKLPDPHPPAPAPAPAVPPIKSHDDPALLREPSSDPSQASVPTASATAKAGWEGTGAGGATPLSASSSKRRAMSSILQVLRFSTQSTSSSQMNTRSSPPPAEPISSSPPPSSPQCFPPDSPQYNTSDHNHQQQAPLPPPSSFSSIASNGSGAPASHVNALEGSLATKSLTRGHVNEANGENGLNVSLHHPLLSLSDSFAAETYSPPGDEKPVAGQSMLNGFHERESINEKAKASRTSKQGSEAQKYNTSSASSRSSYYYQHAETVVLRTDFSTNGISHRRLEFMPMSLVRSPPPHHPLSIGGPIKARKGMRVILTKEGSKAFDEQ